MSRPSGDIPEFGVDLVEACRPRPLPGVEHFGGNEFYGAARILKEYAGLEQDQPLPVMVPHGVCLSESHVSLGEKRAGYPAVLSFPVFRDRVYAETMRMQVLPSASPFLYALAVRPAEPRPREGTVFFPGHSIQDVEAVQDWAGLARALAADTDLPRPIRVCTYWVDLAAGRHRVFEDVGLEVVSAGHINDQEFLPRLVDIVRGHEWAASNTVGSHVFYAIAAGCRFRFIGESPTYRGAEKALAANTAMPTEASIPDLDRLVALAREPVEDDRREMTEIAGRFLRADAVLDREELLEALELAHRLDRRGRLLTPEADKHAWVVPRSWYRATKSSISQLRKVIRPS